MCHILPKGGVALLPLEFLNNVSEMLSYSCRELLGAKEDAIIIKQTPFARNTYGQDILFSGETYRIMLKEGIKPGCLVCLFVDLVAKRLNDAAAFLAATSGYPYLESTYRPCTMKEWAEDFYLDLQNQLFQTYKMGLGIDLGLIDELSAAPYEGDPCDKGGLVFVQHFARLPDRALTIRLRTSEDIILRRGMKKHIRKLLAGAGEEYYILFQQNSKGDYQCMGYCKKKTALKLGWVVSFKNTLDWEFSYMGKPLFRMLAYRPKVIVDPIERVVEKLRTEFGSLTLRGADLLLAGTQSQKHGATLIFADFEDPYVAGWIDNYYHCKRAVGVNLPRDTSGGVKASQAVHSLSRMDGAIFVDVNTMELKYAAAIVDGRVHAHVPGDLARGARHNGIKAFLVDLVLSDKCNEHKVAAVIFSEDGGATTICGSAIRKEAEIAK